MGDGVDNRGDDGGRTICCLDLFSLGEIKVNPKLRTSIDL